MDKIEGLTQQIRDYIQTRIDIIKLQLAATTSKLISNLLAVIIAGFILCLFIIFAGIGLSLLISDCIGTLYSGFLIIAGFFLLIAWAVWKKKEKWIRLPIMNAIIRQIASDTDTNAD